MAFKSKAQMRWAHTDKGEKALGGKAKVAQWDKATTKPLPERLGKTKTQKAIAQLARGMAGKSR